MLAPYSVFAQPYWASAPAPTASITPAQLGSNCVWYMTGLPSDVDGTNTWEYASGTNSIAYSSPPFLSTDAPAQFGTRMGSMQPTGTIQYASCARGLAVPSGTGVSLSFWLKNNSTQSSPKYPFVISGGSFGSNVIAPEVHFSSGVISRLFVYFGPIQANFALANLAANTWHHFAFVASPSATPRLFVNGVAQGASTGAAPSSFAFTATSAVVNNSGGGGLWCGLSDVRVYKVALSDAQVAAIRGWDGTPAAQPITV